MTDTEGLGPKSAAFISELDALCRKHGVQLAASGSDGLDVWDLTDERTIWCAGIEDHTNEFKAS